MAGSLDTTAAQYRRFLKTTSWYAHAEERNAPELAYLTLGLQGESGEFADVVKKAVREAGFDLTSEQFGEFIRYDPHPTNTYHMQLKDELGDVLWYIVRLCDYLGIGLENLMLRNTYKLFQRIHEGDWAPPMELEWPFTNPMFSFDNVQMNLFPNDVPETDTDV